MPQSTVFAVAAPGPETEAGLRERRRERRRLIEQDRHAVQQATLYLLSELLADASDLVSTGWVQHCWFTISDESGARRRIGPRNLHQLDGRPVTGVCLLGAIVQAAGGVARAGTEPVHRGIDLTWATLFDQPTHRFPAAYVRLAYIHDLMRWNDAASRTAGDVAGLLVAASGRAMH
jgi:hypothetical protein